MIVQLVRRESGTCSEIGDQCVQDHLPARRAQHFPKDTRPIADGRAQLRLCDFIVLFDRGHQSIPEFGKGHSRFIGVTSMMEEGPTLARFSIIVTSAPPTTATTWKRYVPGGVATPVGAMFCG